MGLVDQLLSTAAAAAAPTDKIAGYFEAPASGGPPVAQGQPTPQTPSGYQLLDFGDAAKVSTVVDASGQTQIVFGPVPSGQLWRVGRYTIECLSAALSTCLVFIGDTRSGNLRDASDSGNLDVADNNTPLTVPGTRELTFQWIGATPGSIAAASIQYEIYG